MKRMPLASGSAPRPPAATAVCHGAVLRPPVLQWDGRRYGGARLAGLAAGQVRAMPGVLSVVAEHDFVGVVAASREIAEAAAARLAPQWRQPAPAMSSSAENTPGRRLEASYCWPLATTFPPQAPWAIALPDQDGITVWAPCDLATSHVLQQELSLLAGLHAERVNVFANGQPPDPRALDIAADAALLATLSGKAVRIADTGVPAAPSPRITVRATLTDDGSIAAYALDGGPPLWPRPSLARLLAGGEAIPRPVPAALPPYRYAASLAAGPSDLAAGPAGLHDRASATARVFAHESFIDEAAAAAGVDPITYRLRQLDDPRGAALIRQVARQAGWQGARPASLPRRTGRGFAYASVTDDSVMPPQRTWAAWVAEVAVDPDSGAVDVTRIVVGHDTESLTPLPADRARMQGELLAATRKALQPPAFDDPGGMPPLRREAAGTAVEVVVPERALAPDAPLTWSDHVTLPAAAAVANAIFDATGVRLREPPFNTPAASRQLALPAAARGTARRATAWMGGIAAAAAGLLISGSPWRSAIPPVASPDLSVYSEAAIERGRLVAAAGDCMVCHTAPGGAPHAGGRALDTPFGTIYTTNITPDPETGIGLWSLAAFERAMREGVHRDGRRLYPAFPYTSFAKLTDADIQSVYAYLMTQPPVKATPPPNQLAFPYNIRPLLAGWNALFHDKAVYQPDPSQSLMWNRGAYLVQGAGHCGACHTPRNALGAEKSGKLDYLAGGMAEGWEAPALSALSPAPLPWREEDFYQYLRTGFSERHGVAAGPMAPVVHSLAALPDTDIRAMAVYLASLQAAESETGAPDAAAIETLEAGAGDTAGVLDAAGAQTFRGACAVCHQTGEGPQLFGVKPSLALNTNVHSSRPDNLVQVILHGIPDPPNGDLGYMPGFAQSLDDEQVVDLVRYVRARFAPDKPAWDDLPWTVARLRARAAD
ncbi:MAG: c-type cytochrome [Pigmentiphaga sp.]|uniref:c-type cytochrome n=1 Tax=Pigmentiphaga sp. TaxID=1977564 RepID=UPI0029AB1714|nr:c-type cytochrome [Pigmentiphaga sp.]MDX3904885.1 c-type cytochrome [Pigmentiphaga sp.]